ncbi:thiamine pyrophosphate-dependent enzyme [candidate division KSB1 bacterium]
MNTEVLLGDEAVALSALHSGIGGSFAYPGTPATELNEYIFRLRRKFPEVYVEWSANEKTAYEAALGMSYVGKRAIVSMKHVGLNVAADAFMNSAITGVNGGLVVLVADDPGMHSSQNEQDSRYYIEFAKIPAFEPSSQQEAYVMTKEAFRLSEELRLPVLVRLVTRLAHSRSNVTTGRAVRHKNLPKADDWRTWTLLPGNARVQFKKLLEKQPQIQEYSNGSPFHTAALPRKSDAMGVISSGIGHNYFMENRDLTHLPHLKLGVYPLPEKLIRDFTQGLSEVLIIEDGYPYIESRIQAIVRKPELSIRGKLTGDLPASGELNPDLVRKALGQAIKESAFRPEEGVVLNRPPLLCDGCAHREVFNVIDELRKSKDELTVFSDIGCYTLGALRPQPSIDTCVCMGASLGMAKGAANGGLKYSVGVIGDSTFMHSGIPTVVKAAGDNTPVTFVILDNGTTGMTGQQDVPIPGKRIETFLEGLGIPKEHIRIMNPRRVFFNDNVCMMHEELEYRGVSVVIARRECIQLIKSKRKK